MIWPFKQRAKALSSNNLAELDPSYVNYFLLLQELTQTVYLGSSVIGKQMIEEVLGPKGKKLIVIDPITGQKYINSSHFLNNYDEVAEKASKASHETCWNSPLEEGMKRLLSGFKLALIDKDKNLHRFQGDVSTLRPMLEGDLIEVSKEYNSEINGTVAYLLRQVVGKKDHLRHQNVEVFHCTITDCNDDVVYDRPRCFINYRNMFSDIADEAMDTPIARLLEQMDGLTVPIVLENLNRTVCDYLIAAIEEDPKISKLVYEGDFGKRLLSNDTLSLLQDQITENALNFVTESGFFDEKSIKKLINVFMSYTWNYALKQISDKEIPYVTITQKNPELGKRRLGLPEQAITPQPK